MIEEITINNYKIILNLNKTSKITRVDAFINNGFIFENENNIGISHLLEHIITDSFFKCKNNCSKYWKDRGIVTNAMTTETYVQYYLTGLYEYNYDMINYIIDICTKPVLNNIILNKEKKAVINELLIHDSHPQIDLMNGLNDIFYNVPGLKLQDNNKLQIKTLNKIKLNDIKLWYNKYYGSNNMLFMINGNFNKDKVIKLLKKKLRLLDKKISIPKYLEIFNQGNDIIYIKNHNMENTCINFAFPSSIYQRDIESKLIDLFINFINSNVTSILMDILREKKKLIYSVNVDSSVTPYGSWLNIEIFTKNNNIKEVIVNTIKILKNINKGKFSKKYFNNIKKTYMTQYYSTCKNLNFLSNFYGEQFINQIMNVSDEPIIINENELLNIINNINKTNFSLFINKLIVFQNLKIAYQGKKNLPNLKNYILNML